MTTSAWEASSNFSSDGYFNPNMASPDISASGREMGHRSLRWSAIASKLWRIVRNKPGVERCLRKRGRGAGIENPS